MASRGAWLKAVLLFAVVLAVGLVALVVVMRRVETGEWKAPSGDDVVWVTERVARRAGNGPIEPSRVIYLNRGAITLRGGRDDASRGISSVVESGGKEVVTAPGFRGSQRAWSNIVACVRDRFADFDVTVTDARPLGDDFVMVVVGGRPEYLGKPNKVGGLAPFNGQVIPKAVVYAFSDRLGNRPRPVCETIAMEVAHAYGLDHGHHCPDLMTYLRGCGPKRFRDRDVPCGEHEKRECLGGGTTQNSYRHLAGVLGVR